MREQGACLVNSKEPQFMAIFDSLPSEARAVLRESSYDLCAACFEDIYNRHVYRDRATPLQAARRAVWEMERLIRGSERFAA